jgi:hypothetical protein
MNARNINRITESSVIEEAGLLGVRLFFGKSDLLRGEA